MAAIKDGDAVVGNRTKIKIVKNKVASPFRETEVDILYGQGISREGDLLDLAVTQEIVEKAGAWFSFNGERLGQGRENSRTFLKENLPVREKLEHAVRLKAGLLEEAPRRAEAGKKTGA
jgi:recombination protein RecA